MDGSDDALVDGLVSMNREKIAVAYLKGVAKGYARTTVILLDPTSASRPRGLCFTYQPKGREPWPRLAGPPRAPPDHPIRAAVCGTPRPCKKTM